MFGTNLITKKRAYHTVSKAIDSRIERLEERLRTARVEQTILRCRYKLNELRDLKEDIHELFNQYPQKNDETR